MKLKFLKTSYHDLSYIHNKGLVFTIKNIGYFLIAYVIGNLTPTYQQVACKSKTDPSSSYICIGIACLQLIATLKWIWIKKKKKT